MTFENTDCTLGEEETGTGLLNDSTVRVNEVDAGEEACSPPPGTPVHVKEVTTPPTALGGGVYEVGYTLTVSNHGAGAGAYDLADALQFGEATTITAATVANATPGTIVTNPVWDGVIDSVIVSGEPIAAGTADGPEVHTYTVTVQFTVDAEAVTFENTDCTLGEEETGTGLLNGSTIGVNEVDAGEEACDPVPAAPTHTKELSVEPVELGGGLYEVGYTITVSNASAGSGSYGLDDLLQYGDAVSIAGATVVNDTPGTVVTNPAWDGVTDAVIVSDAPIAAGTADGPEVHTYTVTVQFTVDSQAVTFENSDCTLGEEETGTGLLNVSTLDLNEVDAGEEACSPPPAAPTHTKEITSEPTPVGDGNYEIEYTITVSNPGAGAGVYDLADALQFGEGMTIVEATVANELPGDIAVDAAWNGLDDTVIVTDAPIAAGTVGGPETHTYVVSVVANVPIDLPAEAVDCDLADGEVGSGFLNMASIDDNEVIADDEACTAGSYFDPVKELVSAVPDGDGGYTLTYRITVRNAGMAVVYDLDDQLRFGGSVTVDSIATTGPAGVALNAGFDGVADTVLAAGAEIGDGEEHVYTVVVEVTADNDLYTQANADCSLAAGDSGTGFLNTITASVNDETVGAEACAELPPPPAPPAPPTPSPIPVTG